MLRCDPADLASLGKQEVGDGGGIYTCQPTPDEKQSALITELELACELGDAAAIRECLQPKPGRDYRRKAANKVRFRPRLAFRF